MAGPGAKPKEGLLPKNGCLRLLVFYVGSVVVVTLGIIVLASGVLANLPVIGATLGGIGSQGTSTNSTGIVAVNDPSLSSGGGPVAGSNATGSRISSRQAASPQGGVLTAWFSSPFYIAQPGDTLDSIAANFGTTAAVLRQINTTLTEPILGKVIFLPPTSSGGGGTLPGTGRNSTP